MLKQSLQQKLAQKLSPQQIKLMKLIQLPTIELEQKVKDELEENPAIEEVTDRSLDVSDSEGYDQVRDQDSDSQDINVDDYLSDDEIPRYRVVANNISPDQEDKSIPIAMGVSMLETLERQLALRDLDDHQYKIDTKIICCYPTEESFITSHANLIKQKIKKEDKDNTIIIFSAHGLPENKIKKGDPYQWQVEKSVEKLVEVLCLEKSQFILSYQSRVGPLKWIGPSTDKIIISESKKNKKIILIPIAFVSEHSETLVELDIEYKKIAIDNG